MKKEILKFNTNKGCFIIKSDNNPKTFLIKVLFGKILITTINCINKNDRLLTFEKLKENLSNDHFENNTPIEIHYLLKKLL
jgi:hypothetical protein